MTGYFRNGVCDTRSDDVGMHTICVEMTDDFLEYCQKVGNDLSTPMPTYAFPGLNDGDHWCLCLPRWLEAYRDGIAPRVDLEATHISVLEFVSLETLERFSIEGNVSDQ
jgi:uncharacterized protein (DUF2237 family)